MPLPLKQRLKAPLKRDEAVAQRQYALSHREEPHWSGARVLPVTDGSFLHHCPSLPLLTSQDRDGKRWYILGTAISTASAGQRINDHIATLPSSRIREYSQHWSGRWILIGDGLLQLDAAGLLRCFYLSYGAGPEGLWASSSEALLSCYAPQASGTEWAHEFRWNEGIEWFPLPRSRFSQVRRVLPTQYLAIDTRETEPIRHFGTPVEATHSQIVSEINGLLTTFFSNTKLYYDRVDIPLTAGMDSRLLLGAALSAKCHVECFTHSHPRILPADRKVPAKIAELVGVAHTLVPPDKPSKETLRSRKNAYDIFTHKTYAGTARDRFANNQWRNLTLPAHLVVSGNCFEVGRRYFAGRWGRISAEEPIDQIREYYGIPQDSDLLCGLEEWLAWCSAHPLPGVDIIDRFHIEQRLSGFHANLFHAFNIENVTYLAPANSLRLFKLLLALDVGTRAAGSHQEDMLMELCPTLASIPINPRSLTQRFKSHVTAFKTHNWLIKKTREILTP